MGAGSAFFGVFALKNVFGFAAGSADRRGSRLERLIQATTPSTSFEQEGRGVFALSDSPAFLFNSAACIRGHPRNPQ
jgi:hypothetical protein